MTSMFSDSFVVVVVISAVEIGLSFSFEFLFSQFYLDCSYHIHPQGSLKFPISSPSDRDVLSQLHIIDVSFQVMSSNSTLLGDRYEWGWVRIVTLRLKKQEFDW